MPSVLEQLKSMTTVVADTGDINAIRQFQPRDATTNPSLILAAAKMPEYQHLVDQAVRYGKNAAGTSGDELELAMDKLFVLFGQKILAIVPQLVSTEIDARLSFDTEATVERGRRLIRMYEDEGVDTERVLLKIAATWEGIQAVRILEKEGLKCNVTLMFSFAQAVACADAGAYLISPFVGRIYDWYKAANGVEDFTAEDDPGVQSVQRIYRYYKATNVPTLVMGASFRKAEQIVALAGCDLLTISPALLTELQNDQSSLTQVLQSTDSSADDQHNIAENDFRWQFNEDAMATEKLAEGIRKFAADARDLEALLVTKLNNC